MFLLIPILPYLFWLELIYQGFDIPLPVMLAVKDN